MSAADPNCGREKAGFIAGASAQPAFSWSKEMMQENPKSEQGAVTAFSFERMPVRTVTADGEVWFVGSDICDALGYVNPSDAIKQHCKGVAKRYPLSTAGGMQQMRVLSEPDVMRLIVSSTLPAAERFESWIFEDVLPSIRRTGGYTAPRAKKADDPSVVALKLTPAAVRAARALGLDKNAAAISADQAVRKITGASPMGLLGVTHLVAENQDLYFTPTELGQRIGVSGQRMNILLAGAGLQERKGRDWVPTSAADGLYRVLDTGKVSGGAMVQQLKWCARVLEVIDAAAA